MLFEELDMIFRVHEETGKSYEDNCSPDSVQDKPFSKANGKAGFG